MSSELEGDSDVGGYGGEFRDTEADCLGTMRPRPRRQFDKTAVRIMLQVTRIVRFLPVLERAGLRFRDLGFCGHDLI
jgi:hypothetical protein